MQIIAINRKKLQKKPKSAKKKQKIAKKGVFILGDHAIACNYMHLHL